MNEQLSINLDPAEIQSFTNDIEDIISEASAKLLGGLVTRSKHEAYGIAAENFARIQHTLKVLKSDLGSLLNTLDGDVPSSQVIDAISSMHGTTCTLSKEATLFAATCNRMIVNIYEAAANEDEEDNITPLEEYANNLDWDEADDIESEEE